MFGVSRSLMAVLGAVATVAAACAPETTVSCTSTTSQTTTGGTFLWTTCHEQQTQDAADARMRCEAAGGVVDAGVAVTEHFREAPCPRALAIGACVFGDGSATWFYSGTEADVVRTQCMTDGGTFVAP